MARTLSGVLARVHQGDGRHRGEGGGRRTKERAIMVLRPAMLRPQEERGQV